MTPQNGHPVRCGDARRFARGARAALLAATLTLVACPAPEPRDPADRYPPSTERPEAAAPADRPAAVGRVSCEDYRRDALTLEARSREEFRAALGEPEQVEWETVPNRHDPTRTDTLFTLHYPGLVTYIHRPSDLDDLLARVDVRQNRYLAFPDLGIGVPEERILDSLGEPDERTERQLLYVCAPGLEPEEPFLFIIAEGEVEEVQFTYYVD